jgi:tetratricopeptide (TPR) repeat protein
LIAYTQVSELDSLEVVLSNLKDNTEKADLLNTLGYKYKQLDIVKSIDYTNDALSLSKKLNYQAGEIQSYIILGITYKNTGSFEKAISFLIEGLKIAEATENQAKISACLSNIGSVHQTQKDYVNALDYYQQSLLIEEGLENKDQTSIRLYNIGSIYELTDSLDKAYTYYYNSLLIEEELNNKEGIYFALYGIAGVDLKRGDYNSAEKNISRALEISYEINDLSGMARCNIELGKLYREQNNYELAIQSFGESIIFADSINYLSEIKEAYYELSKTYSMLNDYRNAYDFLSKHMYINDSINNLEISSKIVDLTAKYQLEKKEQEIEFLEEQQVLQEEKNKSEKKSRYFLIISFFLVMLLVLSNIKRILKRGRQIIVYSSVGVAILVGITLSIYYLGNHANTSNINLLIEIFIDVLTYSILPIFVIVLLTERVLLNRNLKVAQNLSESIQSVEKLKSDIEIELIADNDKDKLVVKLIDLLFIEANDNYSAVHYNQNGNVKKVLIRSSLKRMYDQLTGFEQITRCHKSYVVNINNISKVTGNSQGYKLLVKDCDEEIPVSRSFPKELIQKIKAKS